MDLDEAKVHSLFKQLYLSRPGVDKIFSEVDNEKKEEEDKE